jgi:tRNA (Thr-GGU) A37 N-methylase
MRNRMNWLTAIVVVTILVGFGHLSFAAEKMDSKRMKRDLGIMEAVLGKLLHQNDMGFGNVGSSGGRGMYFDNYGVVFLVGGDHGIHGEHKVRHVIKKRIVGGKDGSVSEKVEPSETGKSGTKQVTELKERCVEFFGNYADAIGQLKDSDRITVLVDQKADHSGHTQAMSFFPKLAGTDRMLDEHTELLDLNELISKGDHGPKKMRIHIKGSPDSSHEIEDIDVDMTAPLDLAFFGEKGKLGAAGRVMKLKRMPAYEASVKRGDVMAYTSGKIDLNAFRTRVQVKERKTEPAMARKVDIMAGIIDRVLNERSEDHESRMAVSTKGFYHEGLGAVFIAKPKSTHRIIVRRKTGASKDKVKVQDVVKANTIEALADYGHALRALKPTEHIIVQVDFSEGQEMPDQGESQLTLKVRKKHVDDYNRGKINLKQFHDQVEVLAM